MCRRESVTISSETAKGPRSPPNPSPGAPQPATQSPHKTSRQQSTKQVPRKTKASPQTQLIWNPTRRGGQTYPQDPSQEQNYQPVHRIYNSALMQLIDLARSIEFLTRPLAETHERKLRGEPERLYLWAQSFSVSASNEKLDTALKKMPELHATIIGTLVDLENVILCASFRYDVATTGDEESMATIIEGISVYIDCLMDLSPAIECLLSENPG